MKKSILLFFCIIISVIAVSSCTTTYGRDKEKVITAYMESKNLKYYIRPGKMTVEDTNIDAYVMLDFSYQMKQRIYVSDAYTNFTCYNRSGSFIESAVFLLPHSDETIPLTDISTLDRDVKKGYIRVSTILANPHVEKILKAIHASECVLRLTFDDGNTLSFAATDDLKSRIQEAFLK